jgi:ABC-type glycerol-3-phosphate transport system substrate-binding protein
MRTIHHILAPLACWLLAACADPLAVAPPIPPTPNLATPTMAAGEPRGAAQPLDALAASPSQPRPTVTPLPPPLDIWAHAQGAELEALRQLAEDWATQSGRAVRVAGFSADGLRAEIQVAQLQGRAPALLYGDEQDLAAFADTGLLQALVAPDIALLPALELPAQREGQRLGVPILVRNGLVLFYNRKLLSAPPATTDELISVARQLTGDGRYGLVYNWPDARWLVPWLAGLGGAPLDPAGAPQLDSPPMAQALALLQELRGAGPPPPVTYEQGVAFFRNGTAAMAIDGDWNYATYRGAPPELLDVGVAPLPLLPPTGRRAPAGGSGAYLMASQSLAPADREAAQALAAFLLGPESQRRFAQAERLPASLAALDDPAVQNNPLLAALALSAAESPPPPASARERCAWRAISNHLPPLLLGERDRPATQAAMQQAATQCIAAQ